MPFLETEQGKSSNTRSSHSQDSTPTSDNKSSVPTTKSILKRSLFTTPQHFRDYQQERIDSNHHPMSDYRTPSEERHYYDARYERHGQRGYEGYDAAYYDQRRGGKAPYPTHPPRTTEEGHAIVTPPKSNSTIPSPPPAPHSKHSKPSAKGYAVSPHAAPSNANRYYYPQDRHEYYDYEGHYPPTPYGQVPREMAPPSSPRRAGPAYYYDQYNRDENVYQYPRYDYDHRERYYDYSQKEEQWPQPPPSNVRSASSYPPQTPESGYYEEYYEEGTAPANTSPPSSQHHMLQTYNPNYDGYRSSSYPQPPPTNRGTDHKASFNQMMEDTSRTPTVPEAAQEVDFDVMKPPVTPVTQPSEDPLLIAPENLNQYDVLLGRGGGTNSQIGNRHFRSLVQDFQPIYLTMRRKDKPLMARSLVLIVRNRGGRFLKKGEAIGEYYEVGDEKAEAKASQALREGLEVRATTRKRKEVTLAQREMETKKMVRYTNSLEEMNSPIKSPRRNEGRSPSPDGQTSYEYYRNGPEEYRYHYDAPKEEAFYRASGRPEPQERRIRGGGERDYHPHQQVVSYTSSTDEEDSRRQHRPLPTQHPEYDPPRSQKAAPTPAKSSNAQSLAPSVSRDGDEGQEESSASNERQKSQSQVHVVPV
uniref:DUF6824 domain-containing protein n=1 Tax=Ditylum brightwellii TaxID=49249 RepID=A0A7S4QYL5_9STRA